ncbi:MAG: phage holin family protein [Caulobacter sp.]|nr:phage holin family protein [Caulobacter sp.]
MIRLILRTLVGMLGLWLAQKFVPGVHFADDTSLLIAALGLGVVNAIVRPVVLLLTLPLTLLTLGLFLLVINAGMFALTARLLDGFTVAGFWPAVLGSLMVSAVGWIGHMIIGPRDDEGGE